MSQEQAHYGNTSTALVTLEQASAEIDKIVEQSMPLAIVASANFSSSLKVAEAVGTLREIFLKHPGIKKTVEAMKDTKLGFLTDRSPRAVAYAKSQNKTLVPYAYEEIVECCIEAMLNGYRITNNEFNVISGGFYAAKNGKYRKIIEHPEVTDFKFTTTSPMYSPDGKSAKVQCYASWLQNGQLVTLGVSDKDKGKEDTLVFSVRVNSAMGEDAVIGKAISKLFSRVLMRLSGRIMGEATDLEFGEVSTAEPAQFPQGPDPANGDPKPGAKVYEFKKAPEPEGGQGEGPKTEPSSETTERPTLKPNPPDFKPEGENPKAEAPKADPKRELAAIVLAEIKAARPKASEQAKKAFRDIYLNNRDLILSLQGADFEYAKGKFVNAGLSWGDDFLGPAGVRLPDPAQAATSPQGEANGSGQEAKTQAPPLVDFGEGENSPPEDPFVAEAMKYKAELAPGEWLRLMKLYEMVGKELSTMLLGYREAFLQKCKEALEKQNAK